MIKILVINISDRIKGAPRVQEILSDHAGLIKTRLGFHELSDAVCSRTGYLFVHLTGDPAEWVQLEEDLSGVLGIRTTAMDFSAPGKEKEYPADRDLICFGLVVRDREDTNSRVQSLLTSYGCNIRTRLGLHEQLQGESVGLILLELHGDLQEIRKLEHSLADISGVELRRVVY